MNYPPNSDKSKSVPPNEKKVTRITSGEAIRRKKPLGKQFRDTFVGGDARSTVHFVIFSVLIPAAKDALADAGSQGLERLIFGESSNKRRGRGYSSTGPTGHVAYNRMGTPQSPLAPIQQRAQARDQHDFDDIILSSRVEANDVIEQLVEVVSKYGAATISDLYELVGIQSTHVDHKWGWTDMRGAEASRVRNGFLLSLPDPEPIN